MTLLQLSTDNESFEGIETIRLSNDVPEPQADHDEKAATTIIHKDSSTDPLVTKENRRGRSNHFQWQKDEHQQDESAAVRYARRCMRSPSPMPNRQVAFMLEAANRAEQEETSSDESSVSSSGTESTGNLSSNGSATPALRRRNSILKVPTQSESLEQSYGAGTKKQKQTSFAEVQIHFHAIIVGDNPSVSAGAPISIEWKSHGSTSLPVDSYEVGKEQEYNCTTKKRRVGNQLKLDEKRREKILKSNGCSRKEMQNAIRDVKAAQEGRKHSILEQICAAKGISVQSVIKSSAGRKSRSLFGGGGSAGGGSNSGKSSGGGRGSKSIFKKYRPLVSFLHVK